MIIQQSKQFKFVTNNFYPIHPQFQYNISFIGTFLVLDFVYLRNDLEKKIQKLFIDKSGLGFPSATVVLNAQKKIVYIGVMPDPCDYEDDDYPFVSGKTELEHFQEGLLDSVHLAKDNFFHILRTWGKSLDEKPPFLLLYQDEQNWFDLMAFQSKEDMELFVKNHKPINI